MACANARGFFFPCYVDPQRPATAGTLRYVVEKFLDAHPEIPAFVPRDARRTFKTLAGDAGLSKDMRDRLQNHSKTSDVSTRHYDRYDYLSERRAAMAKWAAYLDLVLSRDVREIGEPESNVVAIDRAAALASVTGAPGRRASAASTRPPSRRAGTAAVLLWPVPSPQDLGRAAFLDRVRRGKPADSSHSSWLG
jgi:hypothetical protein